MEIKKEIIEKLEKEFVEELEKEEQEIEKIFYLSGILSNIENIQAKKGQEELLATLEGRVHEIDFSKLDINKLMQGVGL